MGTLWGSGVSANIVFRTGWHSRVIYVETYNNREILELCLRQTVNVRFKLRITQNRKRGAKNSPKQLLETKVIRGY